MRIELEEMASVIAFVSDAVSAINNDDGLDRQSAHGASLTLTWVKNRIEALVSQGISHPVHGNQTEVSA